MTRPLGFLALVTLFVFPAAAQDVKRPQWRPIALHVMKAEAAEGVLNERDRGTRVVIRLELPEQHFVAFDEKKSKVESFKDDKGTDLLATPVKRVPGPIVVERDFFRGKPPIQLTFHAPDCPAVGATKIRIKGSVAVVVGKGEKEVEKKDVAVRAGTGTDFGFGTLKPEVEIVRGGVFVVFVGELPVKSVTLLDADGKEIPCKLKSTYDPAAAATKGQYSTRIQITSAKGVQRCTVRLKHFESVEELTVPVDLEVGAGF